MYLFSSKSIVFTVTDIMANNIAYFSDIVRAYCDFVILPPFWKRYPIFEKKNPGGGGSNLYKIIKIK